jgi:hypothetical protein
MIITMQSEQQLVEAFKRIGYTPDTGKIAIRTLANTLSTNERVLAIIEGACESTVGLLVATDIRVLFVGCSPLKDSVIKRISYNEISSIHFKETAFPAGDIEIQKNVESIKIVGCDIKKSKPFIDLTMTITKERKNREQDLDELNF